MDEENKNMNKVDSSAKISKSAILEGNIKIHPNVRIGHGVVLEGDIEIGEGTRIDDYTVIRNSVKIGSKNWIYPHCTIGTGSQHLQHMEESDNDSIHLSKGTIVIGDLNKIREYTTIHLPTIETATRIGSENYIMAYCHIAHDSIVGNHVVMANEATLGGHVMIKDFANIGLNVAIHQFCKIGEYSMVGMGNVILKDVLPFSTIINQKFTKINKIGLRRNHIDENTITEIETMFDNFASFASFEIDKDNWHSFIIHQFLKQSKRGFYAPDFV
ncbi:MAG: acyl-ACP--UDP-N-acetylglucosamine O-acyltransferase [Nitrosotalea sp.]